MYSCSQYAAPSCSYIFPSQNSTAEVAALHKTRTWGCAQWLQAHQARCHPCSSQAVPGSVCHILPVRHLQYQQEKRLHQSHNFPAAPSLSRLWEEAGKPFQIRTENGGVTINLINPSLRFPVRSHQYETEEWVVWCDMSSENDSNITPLPLSGTMPACAGIRWWWWASALIYVSNWSKLYPYPSDPTWVGFTGTSPPPANSLWTQPAAPPPDIYSCSDAFKMH